MRIQYVFLSTKSAVDFWLHYAFEVVEKVVLTLNDDSAAHYPA